MERTICFAVQIRPRYRVELAEKEREEVHTGARRRVQKKSDGDDARKGRLGLKPAERQFCGVAM